MSTLFDTTSERALILAPQGRDANISAGILREGGLVAAAAFSHAARNRARRKIDLPTARILRSPTATAEANRCE